MGPDLGPAPARERRAPLNIDDESVTTLEDLTVDPAQRDTWTPSGGSSVDGAIVGADLAALDRGG